MAEDILSKLKSTDRTLVLGTSGGGKSNGVFHYLDYLSKKNIPFLVWDHHNEYGGLKGVQYIKRVPPRPWELLKFNIPIIIQPGGTIEYRQKLLSKLLTDLIKHPRTKIPWVLIIEEGHNYAPANKNPPCKDKLVTIYKEGRKWGYGCVTITQNVVGIDSEMIMEAQQVIIFRLIFSTPYLDKKLVKMTQDKNIMLKSRNLEVGQALFINRSGNITGPVKFPLRNDKTGGHTLETISVKGHPELLKEYLGKPPTQKEQTEPQEDNTLVIAAATIIIIIILIAAMVGVAYHFTKEPAEVNDGQTDNPNPSTTPF